MSEQTQQKTQDTPKQNVPSPDKPEQLSEVLLLLDEVKKQIRIVRGLDKHGKPKAVDPKEENTEQFMKVDKQGLVLTNFWSNLNRQMKNPTRFRFFKVPMGLAFKLATLLQKHVENPSAIGEALMKQYEVSADKNQKVKSENQKDMNTNQEEKKEQAQAASTTTATTPDNRPAQQPQWSAKEYRYKPEEVDWSLLNKLGLDKETLEKMNLMDPLLRGLKSNKLVNVSFNLEGVPIRFDARLSLQINQNNQVVPAFHGIQRTPNFDFPFYGHTFSEEDKKNLLTYGNMGRVVDLTNPRTGEVIPSLISIDKLTNEMVSMRKEWVRIPDEISNVKLTDQQKDDLGNGKQLELKGMVSQKGTTFDARVQYNAEKRFVEYLFNRNPKLSADQISQRQPKEAPKVYRNKEFSEKQYERFKEGHTLLIKDFKDGEGKKYSGYITYNKEKGITEFSFTDPRKVQGQAATAQESKTQKAVNTDGKTNEATKNIGEPLAQGQTSPKNTRQQELQQEGIQPTRSKGRKM